MYDITTSEYLSVMVLAHLTCSLWSSVDDEGIPLDEGDRLGAIDRGVHLQMRADCAQFLVDINHTLNEDGLTSIAPDMMGHDLWLTRNGHGAGFWDRGLGELGEQLTKAAELMGSVDLYVGDDGVIYSD